MTGPGAFIDMLPGETPDQARARHERQAGEVNPPRLVMVTWADSVGACGSWIELAEMEARAVSVTSVGWLVRETAACLLLVPHLIRDSGSRHCADQGCGQMAIPRCSVVSVTSLSGAMDTVPGAALGTGKPRS